MKREWKPGDVAMVRPYIGTREVRVLRGRDDQWHGGEGVFKIATNARPLVVIDPEDREAVERLSSLIEANGGPRFGRSIDGLAPALREFANPKPPRPDEPQGLGAVVEDADGKRWTRIDGAEIQPWVSGGSFPQRWKDIDAVRILSEGVTQ